MPAIKFSALKFYQITILFTLVLACYSFSVLAQRNLGLLALSRGAVAHDPVQLTDAIQTLGDQPDLTLLKGEKERLIGLAWQFQQAEDEAVQQFNLAQGLGNFSAQANLGMLYLQQEKWQEAVTELNEQVCPEYLCIDRYVTQLLEQGDRQAAIELLTAYITLYPEATSTPYYRLFGQYWGNLPDEELHALLSKGLSVEQEKDSVAYFYYSALLKSLEGNDQEAISLILAALEIEPTYYAALHFLGQLYLRNEEFLSAVEAFESALQIEPKREWSHYYLSSAYWQAGYQSEAIEAAWQALLLAPANRNFLDRLVQLYQQSGQGCFEQELQQLKQEVIAGTAPEVAKERLVITQQCQP
jgi:tetratricopeptide (TPR) repeat protein